MRRGFLYLVALMDWVSWDVLSWRLLNTLAADFCIEALEEALRLFGIPEGHHSDQGSQFTSKYYVDILTSHKLQVSMDGRGRFLDNVFVERLWRSLKYRRSISMLMKRLLKLEGELESTSTFIIMSALMKRLDTKRQKKFCQGTLGLMDM